MSLSSSPVRFSAKSTRRKEGQNHLRHQAVGGCIVGLFSDSLYVTDRPLPYIAGGFGGLDFRMIQPGALYSSPQAVQGNSGFPSPGPYAELTRRVAERRAVLPPRIHSTTTFPGSGAGNVKDSVFYVRDKFASLRWRRRLECVFVLHFEIFSGSLEYTAVKTLQLPLWIQENVDNATFAASGSQDLSTRHEHAS